MEKHPSLHELDLLAHDAADEAAGRLRAHLESCASCRQVHEDCLANRRIAEELRDAVPVDDTVTSDGSAASRGTSAHEGPAGSPEPAAQEPPPDELIPDDMSMAGTVEGYRLIREIHRGGQGVVYEAWQEAAKRRVAVKVLLGGPFAGEHSKRRFEREIELAANLRHPNIVTLHDSGITHGNFYLVMDYVQGRPLDEYVAGRDLSVRQKMQLFGRICAAVSYAHQRGVIHRDLKPSNILVDEAGQPFVLDFGLAKTVSEVVESSVSMDGQILGTPRYMSPEQARGAINEVDTRTDVYSLGLILYEMLTGVSPYPMSLSLNEMLRKIIEMEPDRPSRVGKPVDSDVDVIVMKALAKEPARRYQSAAELGHDVQCWLDGLPIVARSASSAYLLRKLVKRHRYTSATVALVVVIICSFTYISFSFYLAAERARRRSEAVTRQMTVEAAQNQALASQMTLGFLLQAFHDGRAAAASGLCAFLPQGSRESLAARFLLDSRPLDLKVPGFSRQLGADDTMFRQYIVGEHLLHDGKRQEAVEAYRLGQQASKNHAARADQWVAIRIDDRLRTLIPQKVDSSSHSVEARSP